MTSHSVQNLKSLNKEIKFIIVNNGSTDGTKEYLESLGDTLGGNIEVFNIDLNLGGAGANGGEIVLRRPKVRREL